MEGTRQQIGRRLRTRARYLELTFRSMRFVGDSFLNKAIPEPQKTELK